MKMYYSHDESTYGMDQENDDLNMMGTLGINVFNPNSPDVQDRISILKECGRADEIPEFLGSLIDRCDGVIFRDLADGTRPAQIVADIARCQDDIKPVLQLPTFAAQGPQGG
jgi:hypothetical protein